ncbi:MAG: FAD-dependent oxidoreductase [Candidatus Levybacteria bacterium]|nr:FAD-dependent oxidoreductase [Candidatus Levybacteria bacterium]
MNENGIFFLPFVKKEQLTFDTYTFYFKRTGEEREFTPGQYYEMTLPHKNMDERGDSRVFTISSSPTDKEFITITTKIIQSTFKMRLNSLVTGDKVQFDGPWDDLNFDEKDTSPHVFIAGGIGVTPYHSIVEYVTDKNLKTQMILFASWKKREEMIFDDFFRDANNHLENFSYVPTITDGGSLNPEEWDGEKGYINSEMIKRYVYEIDKSKYFFSGPPAMVNSLKKTIIDMGVPKEKIIFEEFEGYV